MKMLVLQTEKTSRIDLLYKLAQELGVDARLFDDNDVNEKSLNAILAETSFAKDWNNKEDDVWNEFLKKQ
ncbi:MAG: hypothetical protein H0W62_14720 [Chitinophagales bacterium]|nr:hypothetical protein [Chitinophagales bacterium]